MRVLIVLLTCLFFSGLVGLKGDVCVEDGGALDTSHSMSSSARTSQNSQSSSPAAPHNCHCGHSVQILINHIETFSITNVAPPDQTRFPIGDDPIATLEIKPLLRPPILCA